MKILYALQGTGNGHICRAREIIPILKTHGDVDVLISGTQADIDLGHEVKYKLNGLGFIFGKKGGVDILATYKKNNLKEFWQEINDIPVEIYDIIINDFEPVTAWACYLKGKPVVGLSHQAAVLNKKAPQAKNADPIGRSVLKYYAPVTQQLGFHFREYDVNIFPPVIRNEVRMLLPVEEEHYTVYLPAYDDERILKVLSLVEGVKWDVFSKHNKETFTEKNVTIQPITNDSFLASMASSSGVLCGAGFETPAEAMFLEKKLLVVPMKGQYEQQCNAAALKALGIPVIKSLKKKHIDAILSWIESDETVPAHYPDRTQEIIEMLLKNYPATTPKPTTNAAIFTLKKFRQFILSKILSGLSK